jgi:hypothetical protein
MTYPNPKTTQKLLKMSDLDNRMLAELTLEAVNWARERAPQSLPHELPTTSHVLRLLIRRAYQELELIKQGRIPDSGLIELIVCHGGMRDEPPHEGYLRRS